MSEQLTPRYDHKSVEEKIYKQWEKSGYFNPDNLSPSGHTLLAKPYCIIMPPPNANAPLHLGHAVFVTLQDILIRFWRMRGRHALWLPGADHAGFETQVVFDKKLEKESRSRFQMNREEAWKEMWDFTQENKKTMENQLRKLGASCDWSREKFTLDADIIKIVYETFEKLYKDGLVYRDLRVVNWCSKHQTALSDLEVKYVEKKDPLYYIKYGPLTLATVRPETKFGDTALAVNPKDKRYQKYIGKEIEAQGVLGLLKFKVIADEAVDPKFGTGVVKITPAHDAVDFEVWQKHKNEIPGPKIIIDENGRLTGEVGEYKGLKIAEARERVVEAMQKIGILEKIEPDYTHQIATCYKCGTTLEPIPKPQWFVKTKPLAEKAIRVVKDGKIKFYPERIKKVYFHWLKNIRDWNISRQIVWGIRIPAWLRKKQVNPASKIWDLKIYGEDIFKAIINGTKKIETRAGRERGNEKYWGDFKPGDTINFRLADEKTDTIIDSLAPVQKRVKKVSRFPAITEMLKVYRAADDYPGKSVKQIEKWWKSRPALYERIKKYGIWVIELEENSAEEICVGIKPPTGNGWEQDLDVFDTWFSSGQWPFATLMAKRKAQSAKRKSDFQEFYPTDVMETAYDILFFWVARMVMLGLYRTGKIPFKTVYIHGLVRDKDRQKMSKSKGNVIDPLGVAELYGTDAVRMALVAGNTAGNDIVISEEKIRGYRNFATKIWNAARFILINKPLRQAQGKRRQTQGMPKLTNADKKHLAELKKVKTTITKHLEKFEFHLAAEKLYHYFWHTFADKIIEEHKSRLKAATAFEEARGGAESSASSEGRFSAPSGSGARPQESGDRGSEKAVADAKVAYYVLEKILLECLKMLHPFMPFITEEIYGKLLRPEAKTKAGHPRKLLMIEKW